MMKNSTKNTIVNGWNSSLFAFSGGYLTYGEHYCSGRNFVARFQYGRSRDRAGFQKFLIANFSPTEYFSQLPNSTPVDVLKTKGYISTTVKGLLKSGGYSIDQAGLYSMQRDAAARYQQLR